MFTWSGFDILILMLSIAFQPNRFLWWIINLFTSLLLQRTTYQLRNSLNKSRIVLMSDTTFVSFFRHITCNKIDFAAGHINKFICCVTLTKLLTFKRLIWSIRSHARRQGTLCRWLLMSISCMRSELCYKLNFAFEPFFFCCIYYCIWFYGRKAFPRSIMIEPDKSCTLWI